MCCRGYWILVLRWFKEFIPIVVIEVETRFFEERKDVQVGLKGLGYKVQLVGLVRRGTLSRLHFGCGSST